MKYLILLITFFFSLLLAQDIPSYISYLHPKPKSEYHRVGTKILLRLKPAGKPGNKPRRDLFRLYNQGGERLKGQAFYARDNKTIIFDPEKKFAYGDVIRVRIHVPGYDEFQYSFTVEQDHYYSIPEEILCIENVSQNAPDEKFPSVGKVKMINGVSVPSDFPDMQIFTNTAETDSGRLFFSLREKYIIIMENDGTPYFYQKSNDFLVDFKVLPNGMLTRNIDYDYEHFFIIMDRQFVNVDTFTVTEGYITDHHDMLMRDNGNVLLIARDYQKVDMSQLVPGGNPDATVMACHIQEFDPDKNLVWEWRSWDHIPITDAVQEDLTAGFIDYVHMNSIAFDTDSNIVASCRNLSTCLKIDQESGQIIWNLGGVNNSFSYVDGGEMNSYQHMFRPVPGKPGFYTLFDNGNYHSPVYSRALEVKIDTTAMTAQRIWEFRNDPDWQSRWLGGVQRLPNGNTLINWGIGGQPFATEVTPSGKIVYEAQTVSYENSYRSYRYNWSGRAEKPYLLHEVLGSIVTLIFNQFGASDIDYYKIYRGSHPDSLVFRDSNIITRYDDMDLLNQTDYYWRVTSVNESGIESELSDMVHVKTSFQDPGENILFNGDFSDGMDYWLENIVDPAEAVSTIIDNKLFKLDITNGGLERSQIQLLQFNVPLYQGIKYAFEFTVGSTETKIIEAHIEKNSPPWTNYGRIGPTVIDKQIKTYSYEFIMEDATDMHSRVVFNWGLNTGSFFLENVKLIQVPVTDVDPFVEPIPDDFTILPNYPNPFNSSTKIRFQLPTAGTVKIEIYNIAGQQLASEIKVYLNGGNYDYHYNSDGLSSGLYFYRLTYRKRTLTGKMLLLK